MTLLYRTAEWHGLAKLRMHTDSSLGLLESLTKEFGLLMQSFQELTSSEFVTKELPKETAARQRKEAKNASLTRNSKIQATTTVHDNPVKPTAHNESTQEPTAHNKTTQVEKPSSSTPARNSESKS